MKTLGEFNGRETEAEFLVVDTAGKPVLGCKTSEDLGVLKINNVNVTLKHFITYLIISLYILRCCIVTLYGSHDSSDSC